MLKDRDAATYLFAETRDFAVVRKESGRLDAQENEIGVHDAAGHNHLFHVR